MPPRSRAVIACSALLAASALCLTAVAQDKPAQDKPAQPADPQPKADAPAAAPAPAKPGGATLSDRLEVSVGPSWLSLRGSTRGTTFYSDAVSQLKLKQTIYDRFNPTGGAGVTFDVKYRVIPRITAYAGYTDTKSPGSTMTDDRLIGNFGTTGDFRLVEFATTAAPELNQFTLGGAIRVLPKKKHGPSRVHVDGLVEFQSTRAHYDFHTGIERFSPWDPNVLIDPVFLAKSNLPASYDMNFLNLGAGFKIGGEITKKLSFDVSAVLLFFGRYNGEGDLTGHGLPFVHSAQHLNPAFHVPGCANDNDPSTPSCGLIDTDLNTSQLRVQQHASRSRGLDTGIKFAYAFNDWLGIEGGWRRSLVRSVGGTEDRVFNGPQRCNVGSNRVTQLPPGTFISECGDLDKAELIGDTISLVGRLRFF
ncbi:MAG TPA: hypothetical protein VE404_05080 [Verrucomicrobiae bacterium]|nr:hypothetical protein [Verrucomicrobiae bacterium]